MTDLPPPTKLVIEYQPPDIPEEGDKDDVPEDVEEETGETYGVSAVCQALKVLTGAVYGEISDGAGKSYPLDPELPEFQGLMTVGAAEKLLIRTMAAPLVMELPGWLRLPFIKGLAGFVVVAKWVRAWFIARRMKRRKTPDVKKEIQNQNPTT